ncbi:putative ubiquitin-specific protease UBP5 NDAI_0C05900 [Naumovozyma dairenensis CBS 421]|uniref:ubiquitinyl hydrolase 1 n=1 Tax=Naumovozyma dairenensis (strain ATCC 10597 / BCRC 20456 / CBS 421 / NBRC 0211 / NRRL Y-12639) TaxID=1071378 RepID=G0W8Y8_NAUDC|nr:hypothetical protein NDAI_0C05900 [Naumovozyma dairenensis CBS 421]CCD24249.1 hypothetical protein NDAI_0C05900 [Naumovozyma dairenensis CBS 421]
MLNSSNAKNPTDSNPNIKRLNELVSKFVKDDDLNATLDVMLQEGVELLQNYRLECEKLDNFKTKDEYQFHDVYRTSESAYLYFNILYQLIFKRIPITNEFRISLNSPSSDHSTRLLQIYSTLKKTVQEDRRIQEIETFLAKFSTAYELENKFPKSKTIHQVTNLSDSFILPEKLHDLLSSHKRNLLLIDVRTRKEFDTLHIDAPIILPIGPLSFKSTFTDLQIEQTSLLTSTFQERNYFKKRNQFRYIVLYTKDDNDTTYYYTQVISLFNILTIAASKRNIDQICPSIFILKGGITSWVQHSYECKTNLTGKTANQYNQNLFKRSKDSSIYKHVALSDNSLNEGSKTCNPIVPASVQTVIPNFIPPSHSKSTICLMKNEQPQALYNHQVIPNLIHRAPLDTESNNTQNVPMGFKNPIPQMYEIPKYNPSVNSGPKLPLLPPTANPQQIVPKLDLDFTTGLENVKNSCYMNCVIQCLLSTHDLTKLYLTNAFLTQINVENKLGSKGFLSKNFANLIQTMYKKSAFQPYNPNFLHPVAPLEFKNACGMMNSIYAESTEQDCQEFCEFLLDGLHEDLNQCSGNPRPKELSANEAELRESLSMRIASEIEWESFLTTNFSPIINLFQGQYASRLQCLICQHTSTTYQPFSLLSIPVPSMVFSNGQTCNILDCFKEFTKCERLDNDEKWFCPKCRRKQISTKQLKITRLPKNLIIHFKRFDNFMNKNNIFVQYPYQLDLTSLWVNDYDGKLPPNFNEPPPSRGQTPPFKYKLNAVSCHSGNLGSGHYTAYVDKGLYRGWFRFDDASYRPVKFGTEFLTPDAYLLFYQRIYE